MEEEENKLFFKSDNQTNYNTALIYGYCKIIDVQGITSIPAKLPEKGLSRSRGL